MPMTPYMDLDLPTVSATVGPDWASDLNTALTVVDAHDHTSGSGVQVPSAGIDINADLTFNDDYNAIDLRSTRFDAQGSALGEVTDIGCLYVAGVDLYYNDGNGNQIQLTAGGALNAASIGGIGGDYTTSDASVFYTSASQKFTFWQDTNTAANMDMGPILLRKTSASSAAITIQPAAGLASGWTLTLPTAAPASTSFVAIDSSGNLSFTNSLASLTLSGTLTANAAAITAGVTAASVTAEGSGSDVVLLANQTSTGDASLKLRLNDSDSTMWQFLADNSDQDNLYIYFGGTERALLTSTGSFRVESSVEAALVANNTSTGDAAVKLRVGDSTSTEWIIYNNNSSDDSLTWDYGGTRYFVAETTAATYIFDGQKAGDTTVVINEAGAADPVLILRGNDSSSTQWKCFMDNSDSDKYEMLYGANAVNTIEIQPAGVFSVIQVSDSSIISIRPGNVAVGSTPTANSIYSNLIPKAWANTGSNASMADGVNLSVSDGGTGIYDYSFRTALSSADFAVVPIVQSTSLRTATVNSLATTGFSVNTWTTILSDQAHCVIVMGEQA